MPPYRTITSNEEPILVYDDNRFGQWQEPITIGKFDNFS
ncbi:hypothetical protein MAN88_42630 [Microcystis aeruginosa]|nr:hypothetical protein MAN88_42630 [Microcystis aeruginosa]